MNREHILVSLRGLSAEKPTTKMGQIRWAWREIQEALAAGHTLQRVHQRLNDAGIEIGYRTLSMYIGRLKREHQSRRAYSAAAAGQAGKAVLKGPAAGQAPGKLLATVPVSGDPFANIRRERERKRSAGFEYDAFSTNKNLLE
ncbi:MAG: hypothetical protein ABSB35_10965 [Bryobacteraceae bacterium]|jgi:hypothetical protein